MGAYLTRADLAGLGDNADTLAQGRQLDASRWGVTTGCFTTVDQEVAGNQAQGVVVSQVSQAFDQGGPIQNLTQQEIDLIYGLKTQAASDLQSLMDAANSTKNAWMDALTAAQAWYSCSVFCGSQTQAFQSAYATAQSQLIALAPLQSQAYRSVDALMVFAQNKQDAISICTAKMNAQAQLSKILGDVVPQIQKIYQLESSAAQSTFNVVNTLLAALQAFMDALKFLLQALQAAFQGLEAAASFFAQHPNVLIYGGVGLGALLLGGFVWWEYKKFKSVLDA